MIHLILKMIQNNSTSESFEDYDVDESNVIDVDFTEVKNKDDK